MTSEEVRFNLSPHQHESPLANGATPSNLSDSTDAVTSHKTPESDAQFLFEEEKDTITTPNVSSNISGTSTNRCWVEYQRVCIGDDVGSGVSCSTICINLFCKSIRGHVRTTSRNILEPLLVFRTKLKARIEKEPPSLNSLSVSSNWTQFSHFRSFPPC